MESKRMKLSENVTCMRDGRNKYRGSGEKLEGRVTLQDLGADGSIVLKWTIQ
jgi:hypothetical protein